MRQVKFSTLISCSYNRTINILFKPFSLKKWLWFLLIAYLAGVMGGGGNFNANIPGSEDEAEAMNEVWEKEEVLPGGLSTSTDGKILDMHTGKYVESVEVGGDDKNYVYGRDPLNKAISDMSVWALIAVGIAVLIVSALIIWLTWVCTRFKFIWFNSIVNNTTSIKGPFNKYREPGNSLFGFYIFVGFLGTVVLIAVAYWAYRVLVTIGTFEEGFKWSLSIFMEHFGWVPFIFFLLAMISGLFAVCIEHFVVTIMAVDQCKFMEGVRKFFSMYRKNQWDFWLYLFVVIGLGIVAMVVAAVVIFVTILLLFLVGGALFGLLYFLTVALMKLKIVFALFALVLGVPFAVISILLMLSIGLPIAMFFRCLSLYFLSSLDCGYAPFPLDLPATDTSTA